MLTGRIWVTIIKLSLFCPDGIRPKGKTEDNHILSDEKTGRGRAADTEPKGPQKLSGKRTGFGRNSGERVRTEEAIRPQRRNFQVRYGGTELDIEAQGLCLFVFCVKYEKRSELLWN